jgi:hypothetical protein
MFWLYCAVSLIAEGATKSNSGNQNSELGQSSSESSQINKQPGATNLAE